MAIPFANWCMPIFCQICGALVILVANVIYNLVSLICQEIPRPYDKWYFITNTKKTLTRLRSFYSIFLVEFELESPWPMSIIVPVWLFMLWCTPNVASTYQRRVFVPTIPSMRRIPMVYQMYFMNWFSLFQSSLSGSFTLVQNKMTPNNRYGLTQLDRYNTFDVTGWNLMVSSYSIVLVEFELESPWPMSIKPRYL